MALSPRTGALDVGIVTIHLDAMRAFYVDSLGFTDAGSSSFPGIGTIQRLGFGASILRLLAVEQEPPHASPDALRDATGLRFLTIAVTDIDEAYAACVSAGVNVVGPPTPLGPATMSVRAQDPDGNWIEFVAPAPPTS
jgi:catechol 2,3-dioxygenase-like lactoylglutathione lyase family enzyme